MSHLDSCRSSDLVLINSRLFPQPVKIRVEVIFGSPGKNCLGAGICRILSVEHVRVRWKCPSALAWLILSSEGSIRLAFDRSQLLPENYDQYFRDHMFYVEEPYSIPEPLISMLNLDEFTVESGLYSVKVSAQFLTVIF